jgi:hypothetical protein
LQYANAPAVSTVTDHCFSAVFHDIHAVVSKDAVEIENRKAYVR